MMCEPQQTSCQMLQRRTAVHHGTLTGSTASVQHSLTGRSMMAMHWQSLGRQQHMKWSCHSQSQLLALKGRHDGRCAARQEP